MAGRRLDPSAYPLFIRAAVLARTGIIVSVTSAIQIRIVVKTADFVVAVIIAISVTTGTGPFAAECNCEDDDDDDTGDHASDGQCVGTSEQLASVSVIAAR